MNIRSYIQAEISMLVATPSPAQVVWWAAQHCMKQPENIFESAPPQMERLIHFLLKAGHHSPFEHVTYQFQINGLSRSGLAQLTRHRIASYTVTSQHYQNYRDYPFVISTESMLSHDQRDLYEEAFEAALKAYDKLIRNGVPKEEARQVLPNAMSCGLVMTINARSLINFIRQRVCKRNCQEIRLLADRMTSLARGHFPELFNQVHAPCAMDGKCPEGVMSCKEPYERSEVR